MIGSSCYPEELDHRHLLPALFSQTPDSIATAKTLMTSPMLIQNSIQTPILTNIPSKPSYIVLNIYQRHSRQLRMGSKPQFPSGIDCSHFPSDYGAVKAEWLSLGGWIGLQMTPNYKPGDSAISFISTGIMGDICAANTFCSYACPAGYQKSQWPTAQGDIGQSIGGLYCNRDGKLELSNPELSKKLCITGTGEVKVKNTTGKNIPICRTDYPGTESETVPLDTQPNQEYESSKDGLINTAAYEQTSEEPEEPQLHIYAAIGLLAVSTAIVAVCAEYLVASIDAITATGAISTEFVGLILLPIVGNAAEHATAVTVSIKDKTDLAIGVAVGSSMQVALLVIPLVVVLGSCKDDMNLSFDGFQVAVLFVTVLLVNYLISGGKSHWLEGIMLNSLYVITAVT
ncbi:hypothetical protein VE03_10569, partial [Pseudogymnoascus sp. 23342-1-I1]